MTIIADSARTRGLLASIDHDELKRLLYGEVTTPDQHAALAALADEASVDVDLIEPATGEPDHDPRTGPLNTQATTEPEAPVTREESREPTSEELAELDNDVEDVERGQIVTAYMADVAELLDIPAHEAEALIRTWQVPPEDDILALLLETRGEVRYG